MADESRPAPQTHTTFFVLESTRGPEEQTGKPGDLKTGTNLFERVFNPLHHVEGFRAVLDRPQSRNDLFLCLAQILLETERDGVQPCIHIVAHGNADPDESIRLMRGDVVALVKGKTNGIRLANGDVVLWTELGNAFRKINVACRGNLMVVLAGCDTYHLVQMAMPTERAPFFAALCSMREVTSGEVGDCMVAYYETLIKTRDRNLAMRKMNEAAKPGLKDAFGIVTCDYLFKMAIEHYKNEYATAKARGKWLESLLTRTKDLPGAQGKTLNERRRELKAFLSDQEQHLRKVFEHYFMVDLYPENAALYEPVWKACRPEIRG